MLHHFKDLFSNIRFTDSFGLDEQQNSEIEKWLEYIHDRDSQYYNRKKKMLNNPDRPKQRDEVLGEYKSIYVIDKKLGGTINDLELDRNGAQEGLKKPDFSFTDMNGEEWITEVKSPSWRGEFAKELKFEYLQIIKNGLEWIENVPATHKPRFKIICTNTQDECTEVNFVELQVIGGRIKWKDLEDQTPKDIICKKCKKLIWDYNERILKRKSQDKLLSSESRSVGFDIFTESIVNSLGKFETGKNNLLILCPDTFGPMGCSGAMEGFDQLKKIVERVDVDGKISCLSIVELNLTKNNDFRYICFLINIKGHPHLNDCASVI